MCLNKLYLRNREKKKLKKYIAQQQAIVSELEEALSFNLYEEDDELYEQVLSELDNRKQQVRMLARMIIAEYLEDAELTRKLFL